MTKENITQHPLSKFARAIKRRINRAFVNHNGAILKINSCWKGKSITATFLCEKPDDLRVFFRQNPMSNVFGVKSSDDTRIFKINTEDIKITDIEVIYTKDNEPITEFLYTQDDSGKFWSNHSPAV